MDDFRENMRAIAAHPDFDPSFNELIDLTDVTNVHAPPEILDTLANHPSIFLAEAVRVVLAPTPFLYGVARELQMLGEDLHPNLRVVKTRQEADGVLGLTSPKSGNGIHRVK